MMNNRSFFRRGRALELLLMALVLCSSGSALALGGIGSVSSTAQTDSTITITWSAPSGAYSHCSATPEYQVCIKVAGNLQVTCNQFSTVVNSAPYTFEDLTSGTLYKIKVLTKAKKNNKNCKFREVATMKQATKAANVNAYTGEAHLSLSAATGSITATALFNPGLGNTVSLVRVCYKQLWYPGTNLLGACMNPWATGNILQGAHELHDPVSFINSVTFDNLANCRQYKVVAYGYPFAVLIGVGTIHTGVGCGKSATSLTSDFLLEQLVAHHEAVAAEYLSATEQHLKWQGMRNGLLDVLVGCEPAVATDLQALDRQSETVTTDVDLLEYVAERQELLACWQGASVIPAHLTLESYLRLNHPATLELIRGDLEERQGTSPR